MKFKPINGIYIALTILIICCKREQEVPVKVDFKFEVLNDNYSVPVQVSFHNNVAGASNYLWTFENGEPASSIKKDPGTVQFNHAGTYKVILEAWNEDGRDKKEILLQLDSALVVNFDTTIEYNNFSPVTINIVNNSKGATNYNWIFEGGKPETSVDKSPTNIIFTAAGEHKITLSAGNGRKTIAITKKVSVAESLLPDFDIEPSFEDNDYEAPLIAKLQNRSRSVVSWTWSATGGFFTNNRDESPSIFFSAPGTYLITLAANNFKETKQITKSITVLPNSNLRSFTNIRFGINTANSTTGSFFSTILRRAYTSTDKLDTLGKYIDLVFFGLNESFTYNKFISPDSASYYTFSAIPGALKVKVLNSQELCSCNLHFTESDFDAMTDDRQIQNISIPENSQGSRQFKNSVVPYIIVFEEENGRKGLIKIKSFVQSGNESYIIADIKVQKIGR